MTTRDPDHERLLELARAKARSSVAATRLLNRDWDEIEKDPAKRAALEKLLENWNS